MWNKILKPAAILLCGAALLLGGCSGKLSNNTGHATLGKGKLTLPAYEVKAPAPGKIIGLIIEKNERITKDQPLFAIADDAADKQVADVKLQLAKAEAELKAMEKGTSSTGPSANLPQLQANVAAAQEKATKMNNLYAMGAVSRNQAEAAMAELQAATAALSAASYTPALQKATPEALAAKQADIKKLKDQQTAALLKQQANEALSPCTGVVTEVLGANNKEAQKDETILKLQSTDTCRVTFSVSSEIAKTLKSGDQIIFAASDTNQEWMGEVASITGNTVTAISLSKPENVKDGTSVEIKRG